MGFNSRGTFYAGDANVEPYRYVTIEGTGVDHQVIMASTNTDQIVGVTDGSFEDPLQSTAYHASSGNQVRLQDGDTVFVECGGAVDAGDLLTADGSGKAIATTTSRDVVFGRALEDGADTKVIQVQVVQFVL